MADEISRRAIVVGGGTAGCIVAGRLAGRDINPKTGDRLKVAMIEGGDDWTIRDVGIRPGYGGPIRRSKITNIPDSIGREERCAGGQVATTLCDLLVIRRLIVPGKVVP